MVGAGAALGLAGCSGSPEAETKAPAEEAKPASEPAATTSAASNQPAFLTPPDPHYGERDHRNRRLRHRHLRRGHLRPARSHAGGRERRERARG